MELIDQMKRRHAAHIADDARIIVVRNRVKGITLDDSDPDHGPMVEVIANTDRVDLDDEVIVPSGAVASSYFFKNRSVFVDHEYAYERAVGKARYFNPYPSKADHRQWRVGIRHRPKGENPLSDDIRELALRGEIGTSIGFAEIDGGPPTEDEAKVYTKHGRAPKRVTRAWEWLELSYTFMPSNADAQALGVSGVEDAKCAALDDYATKGIISVATAKSLGLPTRTKAIRPQKRVRHIVLTDTVCVVE